MAEKSITNAKTPRQVAKTARKVSGSTRKDRKAAVKSVTRSAAKVVVGEKLKQRAESDPRNQSVDFWDGSKVNQKADRLGSATAKAIGSSWSAQDKASRLGVKPKKIAKAAARGEKAVNKRIAKAAKVQGAGMTGRKPKKK